MACFFGCYFVFIIGLSVIMIVSMWRIFEKAGQPGWAAIVPFYNTYILTVEVARKEVLWFVLMFVPFANIVSFIIVYMEVANKFGKDSAYGLGLFFLPFIFWPMLAFGESRYRGRRMREYYDDDDEFGDDYHSRRRRDDDYDDEDDDYDDRPRRRHRDDDYDDEDDDYDRPRRR